MMPRSILLAGLVALLPLASVAAQTPYDYGANCRAWPVVHGRYQIGTIDFELTDSLRSSQYAPVPTAVRRFYIRAWYPTSDVSAATIRPYFTRKESTVLPSAVRAGRATPLPFARRGVVGQHSCPW